MNNRINAGANRQHLWGRTARMPGEQQACGHQPALRVARWFRLFSEAEAGRREAFLDTLPGATLEDE